MKANMLFKKLLEFDWRLTGICFSRTFMTFVFLTYAAALPVLQKEWGMSATEAGSISSGFRFGYAVSLLICSILADKVGAKPLYLGSMSAGAIFSLTFALVAHDYLTALCLYTLVAFALGGTYTTGIMILADQYPVQRGMAIGFFIASSSLGYALSLFLSGIALPIGGYKLSFLLTCSGPLVGAILSWIVLLKIHVSVEKRQKEQRFVKEVLKNRAAMSLIFSYSLHSWELLGMWAWTPAFLSTCLTISGTEELKAAGFSSYISASFHLLGLLASFSMGTVSDRFDRAHVIVALSVMSAICSFIIGWSLGWPMIIVVCIGLVYAFVALGDSPVLSAYITEVVEPSYLGSALGLRSLLGFGGGGISPLVFGAVLDWTNPIGSSSTAYATWGWSYSILGIGGLGAAWFAYRLRKIHRFR